MFWNKNEVTREEFEFLKQRVNSQMDIITLQTKILDKMADLINNQHERIALVGDIDAPIPD